MFVESHQKFIRVPKVGGGGGKRARRRSFGVREKVHRRRGGISQAREKLRK